MPGKPIKAYEDTAFLKSDACRGVRLQLEFLKAETVMDRQNIGSTIVLFGSARIPDPQTAATALAEAEAEAETHPGDPDALERLRVARALHEQSGYYDMAREFARIAGRECRHNSANEYVVITGGGGGIMEAGNRGASDVGAPNVGLNISLPFEQRANPYITPELSFQFHYFCIRKMHFIKRACALAAFPGGFGTMDELFETLTLIQTGKIRRIPVVLFGAEYWNDVIRWDAFVRRGLISPRDVELFHVCDDAREGWGHIQEFYRETGQ